MSTKVLKLFLPYMLITSLQYEFAKDSLNYGSLYVFMSIRYLLIAAVMLSIARRIIVNKDTIKIVAAFSGSTLFWMLGLEYVSPGDSAVLSYTMPLFSIPVAILVAREKPTRWEITGSAVGFLGVAIYSLTLSHGSLLLGAIFTLCGALCWAVFSVYYRKLRDLEPLPILATQFLVGSIPFIIGSALFPTVEFAEGFFIDLAYMVVVGGIVQLILWNTMLRRERIGKVTTMTFAVPAATLLIQSIETFRFPALISVVGSIVMFLGIFLANRKSALHESMVQNPAKHMQALKQDVRSF